MDITKTLETHIQMRIWATLALLIAVVIAIPGATALAGAQEKGEVAVIEVVSGLDPFGVDELCSDYGFEETLSFDEDFASCHGFGINILCNDFGGEADFNYTCHVFEDDPGRPAPTDPGASAPGAPQVGELKPPPAPKRVETGVDSPVAAIPGTGAGTSQLGSVAPQSPCPLEDFTIRGATGPIVTLGHGCTFPTTAVAFLGR